MEFLRFLESVRNPVFDFIFLMITKLGEETAFMAVAIIVFWCFSKKNGYYILTVGFLGTTLNQFLKLSFRVARPWIKDPTFSPVERAIEEATGYSFPSGHTQNAVGTFGCVAYTFKQKWLKIVATVICFLVPFSRMYLGVHTPLDVFVSFCIATILIFAVKPIFDKGEKNPMIMYILLGAIFVVSVAFLLFVLYFPFPADIDPHNYASGLKSACTLLGCTCGIMISYPIEKKFIKFETSAKWYVQIIKVVLGLALIIAIKSLLKPLFLLFLDEYVERVIRYAIIVIFAIIVWPLTFKLFSKIGACEKKC